MILTLGEIFHGPWPIPQKAASWESTELGAAPRSRDPSITASSFDSLESLSHTPNASWIVNASSVHDQNRSECPETPKSWKVLPFSLLIGRRSFFCFLSLLLSIQLIPDAVIHDLLFNNPYDNLRRKWKIWRITNAFLKDLTTCYCVIERFDEVWISI